MLRATLTKVKRACTLARVPRILQGDCHIPPCNLDRISAIFMKSKSTSCSKDDEDEKCKKRKQLIELAFGPGMPPPEEGIEKMEVAKIPELHAENITQITPDITRSNKISEKRNKIATGVTMSKEVDTGEDMSNVLNATKVEDEDKFEQKVEIIKEPPLFQKSFERRKGVHIDNTTPVLLSNKNPKKQSSGDINMLEMLAKQNSDTIDNKVLIEIEKLGISQQLLKEITNNSFVNEGISTDKSKKDISKPGKISEIDLETRVLEKDQTKMSKKRNYINRRAIKHFAMHMGAEDISKNITSGTKNKSNEVKMKKVDEDSSYKLINDRHFRIELKIPFDPEKLPVKEKENVTLKNVLTSNILTDDKRRIEHDLPLESSIRTQHTTLFDREKLPEIKKEQDKSENYSNNTLTYDRHIRSDQMPLDGEKSVESKNISSNILTDDRHFRTVIGNSPIARETLPQIAREKVKLGNENIKTLKEPTIATNENNSNEPVVLVKKCQDSDCFRITPETPKAQTLTDQLIALNLKIQEAVAAGQSSKVDELKEEEEILSKEVERQNLSNRVEKMFKDERIPRHLLANLTVISKNSKGKAKSQASKVAEPSAFSKAITGTMVKDIRVPPHMFHDLTVLSRNLPKETNLKEAIQNFYEQEHDPELVKPERCQYNSPNDDIVEDKDYSLELDPRVVIRDFGIQVPTYTEPYPPQNPQNPFNYSNYFDNQSNMFPQNTPAPNPYVPSQDPHNLPPPYGGPQNTGFYNSTMTGAVMPNVMPHNTDNQMPSSYSEPSPEENAAEYYNYTTQSKSKETPHDYIYEPKIKTPHAATTSTIAEGKLTENICTTTNTTNTVTHSNTAYNDNPSMTSSDNCEQVHTDPLIQKSTDKLNDNTNNLSNKVLKMTKSTTDKKNTTCQDNPSMSASTDNSTDTYIKKSAEKLNENTDYLPNRVIKMTKNTTVQKNTMYQDNPSMSSTTDNSTHTYSKKTAEKLNENTDNLSNIVLKMTKSTTEKKNMMNQDNLSMSSSTDNSTHTKIKKSAEKLEEITTNLPKVLKITKSTTDKKNENIKDSLKHSVMPGLTPETSRVKVRSESMEAPIDLKIDRRTTKDTYVKQKPAMKPALKQAMKPALKQAMKPAMKPPMKPALKQPMKPAKRYAVQSKGTASPWIDKGALSLKPDTSRATQELDKLPLPALHPNMTLSEMLKNVRQRARIQMCQQFVLSTPARKVRPAQGSCKKPKPPCPPPQKTCPPSEPKECSPKCPPPQPPAPKPCKPCCPDPCATPKCPAPMKKDPCAKYTKTESGTDVLGLVLTLGPLGMSKLSAVSHSLSNELTEYFITNPLFMEEMLLCGTLPESISLTEYEDDFLGAVRDLEDDIVIPDLLHRAFMFPKNYDPWIPIPSWPVPRKVEKKKLVCPKDGCKIPGPPPPGAPCNTIHHPCSGFPNDKKRT